MQRMESEKNISTMIYEACCSQLADNHGHPNNRNYTRAERFGRIAHCSLQTPESSVSTELATLQVWDVCSKQRDNTRVSAGPHCPLLARTLSTGYTHTKIPTHFLWFSQILRAPHVISHATYSCYRSYFDCLCVFCPLCNCTRLLNARYKESNKLSSLSLQILIGSLTLFCLHFEIVHDYDSVTSNEMTCLYH